MYPTGTSFNYGRYNFLVDRVYQGCITESEFNEYESMAHELLGTKQENTGNLFSFEKKIKILAGISQQLSKKGLKWEDFDSLSLEEAEIIVSHTAKQGVADAIDAIEGRDFNAKKYENTIIKMDAQLSNLRGEEQNESTLMKRRLEAKQLAKQVKNDIAFAIKTINERLEKANQGSDPTLLQSEKGTTEVSESDKANAMMRKMIEQEEEAEKAKKRNQNANRRSKTPKAPAEKPVSQAEASTKAKSLKNKKTTLARSTQLTKFALNLCKNSSITYLEHPRIHRWRATNLARIRNFEDKNLQGRTIQHYKDLTDEQILEQRARHHLPGTEKILKDPAYRNIYTFPTNRGLGMVAQLSYKGETHNGIVYIGMTKANLIFHKNFENVNFRDSTKDFFQDAADTHEQTEETKSDNWQSKQDFSLDISNKGILNFKYPDHELKIYPLKENLFEHELAKMK